MKKTKNKSLIAILTIISVFGAFSSCNEDIQLKSLPYLFRPVGFNASVNKTVVTISWAAVDSAGSYTLQVSTDSLFGSKLVDTTTTKLSYIKEYAGETKFFARIRANDKDTTKNSKFNNMFSDGTFSFKTPKENLFLGYGTANNTGVLFSAYMTEANSLDVKWAPGSNVTHLILLSADGATKDSVLISATEATAGEKIVTSLSNSTWGLKIFNNKILRGSTSGLVEGDVVINAGEDLAGALNSATAGQVILLAQGTVFSMGTGTYRFNKDIKIRGLSVSKRPVLCMTSGATTTSSAMGFVDGSTMNYVKFENLDFTGYCDNVTSHTKIGYLFNNNTSTNVKTLSFTNCNLHNYGNTPMRVQGSKNQVIDTLRFNGCVINDIGFTSTYAVVNSNSADLINNINFNNCSVYNFKGSLILRTGQTLSSINVVNCTINQGMQDPGSARYLIDLNTAAFLNGGGVTIKNCIFGSTGGAFGANGMRYVVGTPVTNTGSYYTSDYVDDPIPIGLTSTSIKSGMTSYSGASTSLWNDPTTGNFTLKDTTFKGKGVAGDPRWY